MLFFLPSCNKKEEVYRKIILPKNLPVIEIVDSVKFNNDWYDKEIKVVGFFKSVRPYSLFSLDWQSSVRKFPQVAFLFYVSEKDSLKLIDHLESVNFVHPIIYDPNLEFQNLNIKDKSMTFICYLVKDDKIIGLGNPSNPKFDSLLYSLIE